ncbi:MAG: GMP synthase (glutamine-hydrolysing) [Microgenomates group bacterium Gr01-1014_7]|nr:MAG: GMP synthase (glutamine-hydrolysing) [Microgenomates group bacterium Gr01-1014_7]
MIILVDFGGQTAHLIARRVKELGAQVRVVYPEEAYEKAKEEKPDGLIFSGGPDAVFEKDAPTVDKKIFELGIPILGICYGHQLMGYLLKGEVKAGTKKEFGPATLLIGKPSTLLDGIPDRSIVWLSHGDEVSKLPEGFVENAKTSTHNNASISNENKKFYGIQFHPEVVHTEFGEQILENFLKICGLKIKKRIIDKEFIENIIQDIKDSVGRERAICALSGGVDSSVAAALVYKAIGKNLKAIYIDSGLMRKEKTNFAMEVKIVNARKKFLNALKGIIDPEEKRKLIGRVFIQIFEKEAKKTGAKFLVQGTIYPDVIESAGSKHAKVIKSHHNVGGLPGKMKLVLIEPLRNFYKDEVRKIGKILGLPENILNKEPFPGPGFAVRIIGEVTEEKLEILRKADKIITDELKNINLWQAFAVFAGIKTTGVRGDNRAYGETIAIRAIEAQDAMSANFAKLPYALLDKISTRIVNEIPQVNRVVYDITNKPPATMEWE